MAAEQAEMVATRANEFADEAKTRGKEAIDNVKKTVNRKHPSETTRE
jgi:hypothetical protein